ncbi:MAG: DUF4381 domain-containing protein [Pseudomonadales bacterium]|nr:DUF4381 domain-containing protein [Pseudomonadales bacterium]
MTQPTALPEDPLAALRDIHLPAEVSFWPPAIGWWIILGLLLVGLAFAIHALIKRLRQTAYRRQAKRHLRAIKADWQLHGDVRQTLKALQELMKRTALTAFGRDQVAKLTGYRWTAFLDQTGDMTAFSLGAGEVLIDGPYRQGFDLTNDHVDAVFDLCDRWIRQHRPIGSNSEAVPHA